MKLMLTVTIIALFFLGWATQAQTLSYSLLPTGDDAPSARFDGTIAYDPAGKQIFLFGGQDFEGTKNDLWSYSLTDRRWTAVNPVGGTKPQPRFGHTLVFDSTRRRLILFGGQAGGFFSDVWAFDITDVSWRQLSRDDVGPTRRYGHSAIYETGRGRMVISHGFTNAGRFDDTWAFDFTSNTWRNISPASGGARPLRRCLHHAVYDAANGEMLLYGGCSSGFGPCPQADLWAFDLAANRWSERTPATSPAGRDHYGFAFDAVRMRAILFGGSGSAGLLGDTWEYDPSGRTWLSASLQGDPPTARSRQEGTAAADLGAVFFFGGSTNTGLSNELWMLAPPKPRIIPAITDVVNAFSGEGGAVSPGELVLINGRNFGSAEVTVNGIAAAVLDSRPEQLRVQIPVEIAGAAEARLVVAAGGEFSEPRIVPVAAVHPGILPQIDDSRPGGDVAILATGLGVISVEDAPLTLNIGDREVEIIVREQATSMPGVTRIVARIPDDFAPDPAATVVLRILDAASQKGVTVAIRAE